MDRVDRTWSDARFALMTAAHHFLLRVLPFQHPESRTAFDLFLEQARRIPLPTPDVEPTLIACLRVLDQHVRHQPTLVERFGSLSYWTPSRSLDHFSWRVVDLLSSQTPAHPVVQQAISAIEEGYSNPALSLESIAAGIEQSPASLAAAFRRHTGLTVSEYLRHVRLDHAASLLLSRERRTKEVWVAVGYNHSSNFHHDFKARFGVSPRRYRESILALGASRSARELPGRATGGPASVPSDDAREGPQSRSVLIIDDDEVSAATVGQWLTLGGHDVTTAPTATAGLDQLQNACPGLVLLDYRLPDVNGFECLRELRRRRPGAFPPVVLFTADPDVYEHERDIAALDARIFSKLCDMEILTTLVASATA